MRPQGQQEVDLDSWLGRNLRWVVPISLGLIVGCLIMISLSFVFNTMHRLRSSAVYRLALTKALAQPELTLQLGLPIEEGWLIWGNDESYLHFSLKGSRQNAKIYAEAKTIKGELILQTLTAALERDHQSINILALTTKAPVPKK